MLASLDVLLLSNSKKKEKKCKTGMLIFNSCIPMLWNINPLTANLVKNKKRKQMK